LKILKKIIKKIPFVSHLLARQKHKNKFRIERKLIEGIHDNDNDHASVVYFSINKSATQYIKQLLRSCAIENGLIPVDIFDYAFHSKIPFFNDLNQPEQQHFRNAFHSKGYFYGVFGGMIDGIPKLENYRIIFIIRDPRDILVSRYFSAAYSHPVPIKESDKRIHFVDRRNKIKKMDINSFVIEESVHLLASLSRYEELLFSESINLRFFKYEEMIDQFDLWLASILEHCDFKISYQLKNQIVANHNSQKPKEENKFNHLRKGQKEDYKSKLHPNTIEVLNAKFYMFLEKFSYEI